MTLNRLDAKGIVGGVFASGSLLLQGAGALAFVQIYQWHKQISIDRVMLMVYIY